MGRLRPLSETVESDLADGTATVDVQLTTTVLVRDPACSHFGTLHWLVSQSIFFARVTVFDSLDREDERWTVSTCGYSCIAIITAIFVGTIALVFGNVSGFRKYPAGMPFFGSSSAAISAACYAATEDVDASLLPLMWGAVETEGEVGHCCFTSFDVTPPVVGNLYAARDPSEEHESEIR